MQDLAADRLERALAADRLEREKKLDRLLAKISGKQLYSFRRTASYSVLLHTEPPVSAPFYVIAADAKGRIAGFDEENDMTLFEARYLSGSCARMELEEQIEAEYCTFVGNLCGDDKDRRMSLVLFDLELEFII